MHSTGPPGGQRCGGDPPRALLCQCRGCTHSLSGWKTDLILRKERPFSRAEFERRQPAETRGVGLFVATAEDTVVAKLEWARAGESERQLRDVVGILEVSGEGLDRDYIARWVAELGPQSLWDRANAEVGER